MNLIEKLQIYSSGRLVLLLFAVTTFCYILILFYTIPSVVEQAPEMKLFDMSPSGYTHAYAVDLLKAIGPSGRVAYIKQQLPIDFIYPGLFAVTYTLMLVWLFGKTLHPKSKMFFFALVPAAAGIFDYLENLGIIFMIKSFPTINHNLVNVSSSFSVMKSVLTIGFYILLLYGFLLLYLKRKKVS